MITYMKDHSKFCVIWKISIGTQFEGFSFALAPAESVMAIYLKRSRHTVCRNMAAQLEDQVRDLSSALSERVFQVLFSQSKNLKDVELT